MFVCRTRQTRAGFEGCSWFVLTGLREWLVEEGVGLGTPCGTIGCGLDGVALLPAELEATSRMGTRAPVRPLE